jgi:hypothetical protein
VDVHQDVHTGKPNGRAGRGLVDRAIEGAEVARRRSRAYSRGLKTNTAILPPEHLLDPGAKPAHDLIISGDLSHSLAWTGPNNPLSGSVLHGRAGTFDQTLERALAYRYVAVYRPGGAGLEVFVFDLKTTELLASFRTKSAGGFTQERQELALALEKATGGAFAIDR